MLILNKIIEGNFVPAGGAAFACQRIQRNNFNEKEGFFNVFF